MTNLHDENLSDSMEMYLVTIERLRKGDAPVPLSHLAEALDVTSVSVNEMCRKLQDNGLVIYRPYKGAALTEEGEKLANHTLRRHRIWEVFLVEKLHFDLTQADEIACVLEHATAEEVIDRLDDFLEYPRFCPNGLPIPPADHTVISPEAVPLTEVPVGETGSVLAVGAGDAGCFISDSGIKPGVEVTIAAKNPRNILIEVAGQQVTLASDLAEKIMVLDSGFSESAFNNNDQQRKVEPMETITTATQQIPLNQLKKGQEAIIVRISGKGAVKRRMMDMGIVPGAEIHVIRVAPFGDPTEYSIKGYSLSLRKSEAENIMIELKS